MPKIFWTDEEAALVAAELVRIQAATGVKDLEAARRAQDAVLPEGRRKPIKSWGAVASYLEPRLAAARGAHRRFLEREAARSIGAPAPAPAPEPAPEQEARRAQPAATVEDAIVGAIKRIAMRVLGDPDIKAAAMMMFLPATQDAPASTPEPQQVPVTPHYPSARRPRILVVGAIGPQIASLKDRFGARAEMRFWTTEEKVQAIKPMAKTCDFAVIFTAFVSHSAEHGVRDANVPFHRNPNGVSTAVTIIEAELSKLGAARGAQA